MPTLVLPPRYTSDTNAMWKAAIAAGWEVERLPNWRPPESLASADPVLYGEPLFAAAVADALSLVLIEPPPDWTVRLPWRYRQREIRFTTLAAVRRGHRPAFVKPADDKCFPARVYASGVELPTEEVLPGTTPVLVSEHVAFDVEFRCFALEGELATSSPYMRCGELAQADDGTWPAGHDELRGAVSFARRVLDDPAVTCPPTFVLDVGTIDGGWAVVEANAAWGSGLYGCDPSRVLSVLRRASIQRSRLTEEDRLWVARQV